jgi:heat-inducible transcriptional repressor
MRDCSVVTATYELGEGMKGTIGIIGPKRMDYDKVVGVMQDIMGQLGDLYKPAGKADAGTDSGPDADLLSPGKPFTVPEIRIPQIKRIEIKEM